MTTILTLPHDLLNLVASHLPAFAKVDLRGTHPGTSPIELDSIKLVVDIDASGACRPNLPTRSLPGASHMHLSIDVHPTVTKTNNPWAHQRTMTSLLTAVPHLREVKSIQIRAPTSVWLPFLNTLITPSLRQFTLVSSTAPMQDHMPPLIAFLRGCTCMHTLTLWGLELDFSELNDLHADVPFTNLTLYGLSWRNHLSMPLLEQLHLLVTADLRGLPDHEQFTAASLPCLTHLSLVYTEGRDTPSSRNGPNQIEHHNSLLQHLLPLVPTLTNLVLTRSVHMIGWWPPASFAARTRELISDLSHLRVLHGSGIMAFTEGPAITSLRELVCDAMCLPSLSLVPCITSLTCRLLFGLDEEAGVMLPASITRMVTGDTLDHCTTVKDLTLVHYRWQGPWMVEGSDLNRFQHLTSLTLDLHLAGHEVLGMCLATSLALGRAPDLRSLTVMGLRGSILAVNLPRLLQLVQLTQLCFSDCDITIDSLHALITGMPQLLSLVAAGCHGIGTEQYRDLERQHTPLFHWSRVQEPFEELRWVT